MHIENDLASAGGVEEDYNDEDHINNRNFRFQITGVDSFWG